MEFEFEAIAIGYNQNTITMDETDEQWTINQLKNNKI